MGILKNEELYELTTYEEEEKCSSNNIMVNRKFKNNYSTYIYMIQMVNL